jgi:hypothetical protein
VTENITINAVADLSISDVAKAEGNTGTTTFTFTVSLDSAAPAGGVSFNASTADGTATTANNDYVGFTNQPHTITQGNTSTTVDVTVNGDTTQETNETFFVNITNVTNATVADAQGQGTILNDDGAPTAGQIIISEFRLSGPGAGPTPSPADQANDEFVELYNATDSDFVVVDSSPVNVSGSGWALVSSDAPATPKYIIPTGTRIPARGHYLVANGLGYSLSLYPAGNNSGGVVFASADTSSDTVSSTSATTTAIADAFYYTDIPDGSGLALFRTGNPLLFATPAERLDAVGFAVTGAPFFEGTGLLPTGGITERVQHSFVRQQTTGRPQDTDNNQNDFVLVSTTGGTINGVASQLGAPGPENLSSPLNRGAQIKSTLLDPAVSSSSIPNRVRDSSPGTGPTAQGTLEIRRTFTNKTGADVTRLRFRIVDVTAGTAPAGTADVRALTSVTISNVAITGNNGACPSNLCTVQGTTLEVPPAQGGGGGLNSSLSVDAISGSTPFASNASIVETVSLAGPLAPNSSVNVRFLLGVAQTGGFRFFVIVEALNGSSFSFAQAAPASNLDSPKGSLPTRQKSLPGAAKGAPAKSGQ